MKRIRTKRKPLEVKQTDDGLHLEDSILWFDSKGSGELSFLSSANTHDQAAKVPQVITTEETMRILEASKKRPNALVCQYNRPFSIGRLKMELLPSGSVLGGASLYVETDKGRLLYAPQLQPHRSPTVRQMQLKRAHTLVIGAHHPDPNKAMPPRKKERERFLERVFAYLKLGQWPVILCEAVGTAQEVTKLLTDEAIPVAVHDSIAKVNSAYEASGSKLGHYTRYSKKFTRNKVVLFPLSSNKQRLRAALPPGPVLYIEDTLQETNPPSALRPVEDRFFISNSCDGADIREIIAAVGPKELYIFGPYSKRYVEEFKSAAPKVMPLYANDQPTLF